MILLALLLLPATPSYADSQCKVGDPLMGSSEFVELRTGDVVSSSPDLLEIGQLEFSRYEYPDYEFQRERPKRGGWVETVFPEGRGAGYWYTINVSGIGRRRQYGVLTFCQHTACHDLATVDCN